MSPRLHQRRRPNSHLSTAISPSLEDRALLARFTAGDEESLAVLYERHRPALSRQAARLLYASGHDGDDVLQDVFLRVHGALRSGVVPLEPRAWLLRLVHNACVDELRRARSRPVGTVELEGVPALSAQLPDELARRAEAHALLGDIHRLPPRQRSVLVLSALEGLSHEEVAGRLDTTVETTRSLLARARENLRRTAAARETACTAVCSALDEAAVAGVRASEIARRHLWTCGDCRGYQRDLRATPSRLRRLAGWSPWGLVAQLLGGGGFAGVQKVAVGACCALVVGGGAVAVPELAIHARDLPRIASVSPEIAVRSARATPPRRVARAHPTPAVPGAPRAVVTASAVPTAVSGTRLVSAKKKLKPKHVKAAAASSRLSSSELRQLGTAMRQLSARTMTEAERLEVNKLMCELQSEPAGSRSRSLVLAKLSRVAFGTGPAIAPPKGVVRPEPTAPPVATPAPTPAPAPVETAIPVPAETPTETPTAVPTPIATATPSPAPAETPTATPFT